MKRLLTSVGVLLVGCWLLAIPAAAQVPAAGWQQYADPADAGFDAEGLEAARQIAEEIGSGAVMVVAGDRVVAAWGDVERKFKCHSMRKSFLSALYGPAVAAGDIDLSQTLGELGIDDREPLTATEKQATVEQLLEGRSGIYLPAAKEPPSTAARRPERGSAAPGESFWYNNWDFNTAGLIYERAVGRSIFPAFDEVLARPLGMEDWQLTDGVYQFERNHSRIPAYAFRLSARDAARFGLLYLHRGRWGERRIVPEEWIDRSWKAYSRTGWQDAGYGYLWWIYPAGSFASQPETATFMARGTGGQIIAVLPQLGLVIVHRADTDFSNPLQIQEVWRLLTQILAARTGPPRADAVARELAAVPFAKPLPELYLPATIELPAETLDRYVGRYIVENGAEVVLERLDDFLVGSMTGFGEADFFPISETELWGKAVGAFVRFELDAEGKPVGAVLTFRGQTLKVVPAPPPAEASAQAGGN